MDLIRLAIKQPVTVIVGVVLLVLGGVISLERLPIQLTPSVEGTIISVTTMWEGASPEEIEQNVVDPQEEKLLGLSNLRLLTSKSQQGVGKIRLEFLTGTPKGEALREVSDKLREVPDYPENVDEPVIADGDPESKDYIAWMVLSSTDPSLDVRTLRDFAVDRIEPFLERIPGVAAINVVGGREREVQVRVDALQVAQHGIRPSQFADAIADRNVNISAGERADGKRDVRLRTVGQFRSLDEIRRTVIAHTPSGDVLVGDVAEVVQTYKEPDGFVRSRGRPVIAINAENEIGSNVMEVMGGVEKALAQLNAPGGLLDGEARRLGLDGSLALELVYSQTQYIEDALALVRGNIWVGGALATLSLLLFLRSLRSVGIIAIAIPISVIGAVVAMVALGRSINVVSLAGLAFATGMVVDNAIVVLENIFRHIEMGKPAREAAYDGAREVWGAVLASTVTTVIVFIPILLIQEEAGQLFRDIAIAICAAIALSLVVSVTVVPAAAARLLASSKARGRALREAERSERGIPARLGALVYRASGGVLLRLVIITILTGASIAGTWFLMPPLDYLPRGNRNLVFGMVILPPGYNLDRVSEVGARMEEVIRPFWEAGALAGDPEAYAAAKAQLREVPTFDWMTQRPGDPVVPPPISNYFLVAFEDVLFHGGVSAEPSKVVDLLPLFSHATRPENAPGAIAFPFQVSLFRLGGSTGSAAKVQLSGSDLEEVSAAAMAIYPRLVEAYHKVQPVPGNFMIPAPEVQVVPDVVRLSELSLTTRDVGLLVRAMGDGAIVDDYNLGGETIDLKVIAMAAGEALNVLDLEDVPIAAPGGRVVSLGSIASIERVGSPAEIARVGRQRSVSFEVTPPPGVPLEKLVGDIEGMFAAMRASGEIPPSVLTSLAGSASKLEEVRSALLGDGTFAGTLGSSLVLALIVCYLSMCVLFQSFVHPLVIMFSVPLATLGGFLSLFAVFIWSVNDRYVPMQTLDIVTMLGFVILIGTVVNNAILIVHQALNFLGGRAEIGASFEGELTPRRAVAEAVRSRVRPIFMTTLTTVGGLLPLVLMPGSGSELYRGLGAVVLGGLVVSTIFTLLLVPLLLSLVLDLSPGLRRRAMVRAKGGEAREPAVPRRPVAQAG